MPRPRGLRFAALTALVCCVVLGAALAILRYPVIETWHLYRLRSPQLDTRLAAAQALVAMRSLRAIPHLLEQAETHEIGSFLPILQALVDACGPSAREAASRVSRLLDRPSLRLQYEAIELLARPELRSPAAAAGLSGVLWNLESPFRVRVAAVLAEFGDDGRVAEPGLAFALEDGDPVLRKAARDALRAIGGGTSLLFPALIAATASPAPAARLDAVEGLAACGGDPPQAVAAVGARLLDDAPEVREAAMNVFRRWDLPAARLVAAVQEALVAPDPRVREFVAARLELVGELAAPALPFLRRAARDPGVKVHAPVYRLLGRFGAGAAAAVPELIAAFDDPQQSPAFAAHALSRIGAPALPAVLEALRGASPAARHWACVAAGKMGPQVAAAAVPLLAEVLREQGPEHEPLRYEAARALTAMGMEARGAVPELIAALKEDRPRSEEGERRHSARVSSAAITALAGLGAGAVEPLVQVLASGDREAIPSAFQALGRIGPRAAPALPHFIEQALSAGRELRNDALLSLPGLGPAARPAVPVLAAACRAPTPVWMQTNSIQVLGRLGPEATAAAPALREILASPVSEARPDYLQREAAAALIRILPGDPEPQRFLAAALADRSLENRSRIANQLGEALEPVTETVQALGQALVDGDEGIHYPAVESLRRFGPAAKEALPGLIEALHDAWDLFRTEALLTIASLGPEGKDAVPALAEIMTADDGRDARTAAFALHEIRNDLDRVLPQLLEAAARSNPWAVKALGHAGPEPRSLELLREMVDLRKPAGKPDPLLCAAAESLFRLGHHPEQMARILAVQLRLPEDPATGTSPDDGSVRRSYPARQDIARTLGELGPGAIGAEAALEEAAVDADDPLLRLRAVEALYRITAREEAAVPRLVELLERFGWYLQGEPARVLGDLEARAAAAVPALVSALGDRHTVASSYQYPTIYVQPEDRHVSPRARVARALGRIGKPAAAAVPALREALDDGDRELRQEAAAALERILR